MVSEVWFGTRRGPGYGQTGAQPMARRAPSRGMAKPWKQNKIKGTGTRDYIGIKVVALDTSLNLKCFFIFFKNIYKS